MERAAVQVDTGDYRLHKLLNRTFSYVAGSRPEYALAVFTDNKEDLVKVMDREHEVHTALTQDRIMGRTVAAETPAASAAVDVTEQRAPAAAPRIVEASARAAAMIAAREIDTGIEAS